MRGLRRVHLILARPNFRNDSQKTQEMDPFFEYPAAAGFPKAKASGNCGKGREVPESGCFALITRGIYREINADKYDDHNHTIEYIRKNKAKNFRNKFAFIKPLGAGRYVAIVETSSDGGRHIFVVRACRDNIHCRSYKDAQDPYNMSASRVAKWQAGGYGGRGVVSMNTKVKVGGTPKSMQAASSGASSSPGDYGLSKGAGARIAAMEAARAAEDAAFFRPQLAAHAVKRAAHLERKAARRAAAGGATVGVNIPDLEYDSPLGPISLADAEGFDYDSAIGPTNYCPELRAQVSDLEGRYFKERARTGVLEEQLAMRGQQRAGAHLAGYSFARQAAKSARRYNRNVARHAAFLDEEVL
jgi:hypothetical protein